MVLLENINNYTFSIPNVSSTGLRLFFSLLLLCILLGGKGIRDNNIRRLFFQSHGWSHRVAGAAHLGWLLFGSFYHLLDGVEHNDWAWKCLQYDVILGILGTVATLTAARDFPHRHVYNQPGQSGTLSRSATVTQSEMIEHSFYQFLNLVHAMYLHWITWLHPKNYFNHDDNSYSSQSTLSYPERAMALFFVTSPWLLRKRFPVHSFSANWKKTDIHSPNDSKTTEKGMMSSKFTKEHCQNSTTKLETILYQIKKWQYVFYKHVIFYGVNISVAIPNTNKSSINKTPLPLRLSWRIFWIALNASYVMEFFLQTLVKRHIISQQTMINLQRLLMSVSSIIAITGVLGNIRPEIPVISLFLNFNHRGHEVTNTMLTALLAIFITYLFEKDYLGQYFHTGH